MSDIGGNEAVLIFRFGIVLDFELPRLFWIMIVVAPFGLLFVRNQSSFNEVMVADINLRNDLQIHSRAYSPMHIQNQ